MPKYEKLPRKLKKQLKKNFEEWAAYLKERKAAKERSDGLDVIFTRNYKNSHKIFRKIIGTDKL